MKRRSLPPGPNATSLFANLAAMRREMLPFFMRMHARYGDLVHFRAGPVRIVLLKDLDAIRRILITDDARFIKGRALRMSRELLGDGLLTSEGDFHLSQRRMIQPVFRPRQMSHYATHMTECSEAMAEEWEDGATVDVHEEMMRLTLLIVGRALFGTDVRDEVRTISDSLNEALGLFNRVNLPFAGLIGRLPLPSNRRFHAAHARLDEVIHRLIDRARADQGERTDPTGETAQPGQCPHHSAQDEQTANGRRDLLSLLLRARDAEDDNRRMTDRQVRDEALTLLLAGHETTAVAMTWTFHLLAQNPEAEAKLHAELDRVLPAGRAATYDDLPSLPYTRRVLTESMRLLPPAYTIARTPQEDYPVGDRVIPAGTQLLMSQYVIHRDPELYPDPERFEPDRWTEAFAESLPRFAYFPFGGGPRICIGEGFAWTELIIALATLARRWRPRPVPDHPVELQPAITLRPKHGMRMTLHRRPTGARSDVE